MRPPSGVYFTALLTRFTTICASRVESASTGTSSGASSTFTWCRRASISGREDATAPATRPFRSMISLRSTILPRVIRLTSRRSSTMRARCIDWRSINGRSSAGSRAVASSRMSPSALTIAASGLRSSWASIARNSFICCSLCCIASSRRRAVRSRVILAKPRSWPSVSWRAVMCAWAQNRVPSLRTRHPSSFVAAASRARASARPRDVAFDVFRSCEARDVRSRGSGGRDSRRRSARRAFQLTTWPSRSRMKIA